jgi:hypothetical protein
MYFQTEGGTKNIPSTDDHVALDEFHGSHGGDYEDYYCCLVDIYHISKLLPSSICRPIIW